MKQAIFIAALLLLSQPSLASNLENHEDRITKLEQQVRMLSKQVKRLKKQIAQDSSFSDGDEHMYQCKLRVFGDQYTGRSSSRGNAIAEAVDSCSEFQDEMFCRPESVQCHKF